MRQDGVNMAISQKEIDNRKRENEHFEIRSALCGCRVSQVIFNNV